MTHRLRPDASPGFPPLLVLAAALLCGAGLLACSSGEPTNPAAAPGADGNYVFATVTLLDRDQPCDPGVNCAPEFFNCTTLLPYFAGQTWEVRGDIVAAGVSLNSPPAYTIAVAATDATQNTGVAIEFRVPDRVAPDMGVQLRGLPGGGDPCTSPGADVNGVFVDLDALCARVNADAVQESRFTFNPCEPWSIEITDYSLDTAGELEIARSIGGNDFAPAGIMEGRFSFVGTNLQSSPSGPIQAYVQIEGCFRVNVPPDERGVPSNPVATNAICSP